MVHKETWNLFPLGRDSLVPLLLLIWWAFGGYGETLSLSPWCLAGERSSQPGSQSQPGVTDGRVYTSVGRHFCQNEARKRRDDVHQSSLSLQRITLQKPCGLELYAAHNWVESITEYFICALGIEASRAQQKLSGNRIFLMQPMILTLRLPFIWTSFANTVSFTTKKTFIRIHWCRFVNTLLFSYSQKRPIKESNHSLHAGTTELATYVSFFLRSEQHHRQQDHSLSCTELRASQLQALLQWADSPHCIPRTRNQERGTIWKLRPLFSRFQHTGSFPAVTSL